MSRNTSVGMGAFHGTPVTYTRPCSGCDGLAVTTGICGPANICDACTASLTAFIRGEPGAEFRAELRFPLYEVPLDEAGNPVSCGLRTDLPKAARRHAPVYLGVDARHTGDGGFEDLHIYACAECGADQQTRTSPAEKARKAREAAEARAARRRRHHKAA